MSNELKDKNVVITGSTGRLGSAIWNRFSDLGACLIGVNRSHALGADIYSADFADESSVQQVFRQIGLEGKPLSAVIHTVGLWTATPFPDLEVDDWKRVMDANLTSTCLIFREAVRYRMDSRTTEPLRLIAFASRQGADLAEPGQAAYSASKAGVVRLVESIAAEFEGRGVTAHAIAPSTILYDPTSSESGIPVEEIVEFCATLCGRAGDALNGATIRAYGTASPG